MIVLAESERKVLKQEIKGLASDLACKVSTDCNSIGFGSMSCGGYSDYIIYSTQSVSTQKMELLTQNYTELDEQYNEENNIMSVCSIVIPKISACLNSECVNLGDENNALSTLHWAAQEEDIDLIYNLVNQGVSIDVQAGTFGDTVLQHAIREQIPLEIIKLLVELGANVNATRFSLDKSRSTPLHISVSTRNYDALMYLVGHGADKSAGGETSPYYYADYYFKDHPQYHEIKELLKPEGSRE